MASAALIFHGDGRIEATAELKDKLHLQPGARLELVAQDGAELHFRIPLAMRDIKSWHDLEGILADTPIDLNEERRKERERELQQESQWRE